MMEYTLPVYYGDRKQLKQELDDLVFFIDEGFGVLDSDNIANVGLFLEELTSYFRFILCISHLDVVKDYVAKELFIVKDNGHSQLIS